MKNWWRSVIADAAKLCTEENILKKNVRMSFIRPGQGAVTLKHGWRMSYRTTRAGRRDSEAWVAHHSTETSGKALTGRLGHPASVHICSLSRRAQGPPRLWCLESIELLCRRQTAEPRQSLRHQNHI